LKQGWYAVEAITKDKDGNEVKDIEYVQLYDEQSASPPSPQTNWRVAVKDNGQPGEKAKLVLGTSEKDVHVIQQLQQNGEEGAINQYSYFQLNDEKKSIETDITEESRERFGCLLCFCKAQPYLYRWYEY
jgi:hypothetical protein